MTRIDEVFAETIAVHQAALRDSAASIQRAVDVMRAATAAGGKILVFGNGGSAADAQHFAAELINRFQVERRAIAAIALTTDTSVLTSIANDSSYDDVFARQIEGLGRPGDVAFGISTSGRSASVIAALTEAKRQALATVALVGRDRSMVDPLADVCVTVPSAVTARVQEVHHTILHVICELLES